MAEPTDTPGFSDEGFSFADLWAILQLQRRVVLGCVGLALTVAVLYSVFATRLYTAVSVVHLTPVAGQEINSERVVDDLTAQWNRHMFVSTQIALLESRMLRLKVLERYAALGIDDGLGPDDSGVGKLAKATEILPRKGTELIDVRVTTTDPDQSARLANLIAQVFSDENLAANTDAAASATKWLESQLIAYEGRIEKASGALIDYEREHDMADAHQEVSGLDTRMGTLNSALAEALRQRVEQETLVANHERLLKKGAYDELAKQMNTQLISSLTARYAAAITEHARLNVVFTERAEESRINQAELESIERELRAEVENVLATEQAKLKLIREREEDLEAELATGKGEMLTAQGLKEGYEKRRLELDAARTTYAKLNERIAELELQSKTQLNRVRIVEEARPPKKASYPLVSLTLGAALVGGLVVGLAAAFAREWFDDTITSPLDVTTYVRAPFLGLIPKIAEESDETELTLHTHRHPKSSVAEAMRAIRTTLDLNPLGAIPKRILVTSAVSAEGKTSTAVRLAIAFANLNRRVVVIDADLRRPRLHKVFGGTRDVGLTTLVAGEAELADVVHATEVPNLSYVSSGRGGERPNELLSSPEVPAILDRMSAEFDVVIVDSPPSVILSDSRVLSRHVDGVVLVVREHSTSRALVREAIHGLEQVGARVLGVVINAVDFSRQRTNYKYSYGYGYGYGYRYDQYTDDEKRADSAAK